MLGCSVLTKEEPPTEAGGEWMWGSRLVAETKLEGAGGRTPHLHSTLFDANLQSLRQSKCKNL